MRRGPLLRRLLVGGLLTLLGIGVLVYWRPVAVANALQRGLLVVAGIGSEYVQIGPYRIHYLIGGDGSPLLLLPGHPSRALEGGPLLPALIRQHRVVALDFLGYGESDAPDVDYSITTQTGIVTGLLDALGLSQVDVLGFSMGGWVALKLAADHPKRVRRLVLVGSGGLRFPTLLRPASWAPRTVAEFREIEAAQSDRRLPTFVARDLVRLAQPRGVGTAPGGNIASVVPRRPRRPVGSRADASAPRLGKGRTGHSVRGRAPAARAAAAGEAGRARGVWALGALGLSRPGASRSARVSSLRADRTAPVPLQLKRMQYAGIYQVVRFRTTAVGVHGDAS